MRPDPVKNNPVRNNPVRDRRSPLEFIEAGQVDYQAAWDRQRTLAADRAEGRGSDTVLLLTHPPVYTAGRRTEPGDRPSDGTPVIDVDRGGRITWHGPGQLVGYPLVKLAEPMDVVAYVRLLEQTLMAACSDLGLPGTGRVAGRSGVWLPGDHRPERKIAAIGVRVARGVTTHGFALNCDPDLGWYDRIVPCGIRDAGVTSLTAELGRTVSVAAALPSVRMRLEQALTGELEVDTSTLDSAPPTNRPEAGAAHEAAGARSAGGGIDWQLDPVLSRT